MGKKVLIVGGVAGGASAAARLRRLDENAEIILFERGEYISYANCGLPYHVGGAIPKREALLLQTPQVMRSRFNIDVRVRPILQPGTDGHSVGRTEDNLVVMICQCSVVHGFSRLYKIGRAHV